jgi:hypothetical protein
MSRLGQTSETGPKPTPFSKYGEGGMIVIPWEWTMTEGSGYDTVSRTIFPSAATNEGGDLKSYKVLGHTGQYVDKKVTQVERLEQVSELLQFGTELEIGYDVFSANSIGRFLKESRVDSYSLYFLVICYARNTEVRTRGYVEDPRYRHLTPDEFRARFGDYFVAGWVEGGYLIGLAEIQATSKQALTEVQTKLKGKYSGIVDVSGGFSADWQSASTGKDVTSKLSVIYAGMNGKSVQAYAQSVAGSTKRESAGGATAPATPPVRPDSAVQPKKPAAGGRGAHGRDDDEIPDDNIKWIEGDDHDDDDEYLSVEDSKALLAKMKANETQPRTESTLPPLELDPIKPRLVEESAVDAKTINMTMDGLLNAADELPRQVLDHGVPLFAILQPYSIGRGSAAEGIDRKELRSKRKKLTECYMKASYIYDSVTYALSSRIQFTVPEDQLKATQKEMRALKERCVEAWKDLKRDPDLKLGSEYDPPDEERIPAWAIEKTTFRPFPEPLNPALLVEKLEKAVETAVATQSPEARTALTGYLKFVLEKSAHNYGNAKGVLEDLSLAFASLDDEPDQRSYHLDELVLGVEQCLNRWKEDRELVDARYKSLDGKAGLTADQLGFLTEVNKVVLGSAEAKYGFQTFWKTLHEKLRELAQMSKYWGPGQKFRDLIDYGGNQYWSQLPKKFEAQQTALSVQVRKKLP